MEPEQEQDAFNKANEKIHPVETQWHYPILQRYGFEPVTKEAKGFVRSYSYKKGAHEIICTTGVNADHWKDTINGSYGYWKDLEPHLKGRNENGTRKCH